MQWDLIPTSIKRVLRNQSISLPFFIVLTYLHDMFIFNYNWLFNLNVIYETTGFILLLDLVFYIFHRLCHYNKWLFKNIHREHHEWVISMGLGALDMSVPDYFLTALIPVTTSLLICTNITSIKLGLLITGVSIVMSHSGYHIIGFNTNVHDIHHIYYTYNYSALWDRVFGTYRPN